MTLITLQDGKVVMRDGKVGTEQECCCGCVPNRIQLVMVPVDFVSIPLEVWPDCWSGLYDLVKERVEAAGWTVTYTLVESEDPDFGTMVTPVLTASGDCTFDCDALVTAAQELAASSDSGITNQPEGLWVDLNDGDGAYQCPPPPGGGGGGSLLYPQFRIDGCCGAFDAFNYSELGPGFYAPYLVNGEGNIDGTSCWIPSCNPLP